MHIQHALAQLEEIHAQVLRSEVYRGYRARSCAVSATLVLLAACAQELWWPASDASAFAAFWSAVALVCAAICGLDPWLPRRVRREPALRTTTVALQLVPALAVGAALPWILLRVGGDATSLVPGLWATLFGLGVFASRPYLPRAIGWVAFFYVGAGGVLLLTATPGVPSPWSVGVPFAIGQAACALVLWFELERRDGS